MKRNVLLRAAALLLVCSLFGLCTVAGTQARWLKNFPGSKNDLVRAGVFDVEVTTDGGQHWYKLASGAIGGSTPLDLFTVLYEENTKTAEDPTHVVAAPKVIAPGTSGELKVTLRNYSEVDVKVSIGQNGTPTVGGTPFNGFTFGGSSTTAILPPNATSDVTFEWTWGFFTQSEAADTAFGIAGGTCSVPLLVSAAQILPGEA